MLKGLRQYLSLLCHRSFLFCLVKISNNSCFWSNLLLVYRIRCSSLLFFLLFAGSLFSQSYSRRLDSILNTPRDTHQLNILTGFLAEMINIGEIIPDSIFEQALALGHELKQNWSIAILHADQSGYYLNTGEVEKGLASIDEAIKYAEISDEPFILSGSYATKVQLLIVVGRYKEAAELASSLAKKYHAGGEFYNEAEICQMLSSLSSSLGNYKLTIQYDSTAVALARKSGYVDILASSLRSASDNLTFLGFPEKGLKLAEEAFGLAEKYNLQFEVGNILSARATANTALGNYQEALKDYEKLKVLEGDQKFTWWMIGRGTLLQRVGRHEEARSLLLEAIQLLKATSNDHLALKKGYEALQTVDLDQSQYDSIAKYRKLMEAEQDSIQTTLNTRNLLEIEEKYKTEEKEAEIRLQQEQLATQRMQLYATIFGLSLALVAGITFYFLSQNLKRRNQENEQLLMEKETLIGEIHHRVKNNLQVVSSLLQLQRRGLESDDDKGREALLESQSRVSAMGLIHNKLYQGKEVTSVHMRDYLEDLGRTLLDAYRLEEQVEIFYDVADLRLDVDTAIPLGLIINELVTNSLKYAFPDGREGTIEIAFHREGDLLYLAVMDNGVGTAGASTRSDSTSFGTSLIGLLTKKLKGTIQIFAEQGYGVKIVFPEKVIE